MKKLILILISILLTMCNSGRQISNKSNDLAPLIIYKTNGDYSNNIPVVYDSTQNLITSFPGLSDVYINKKFARPDKLANGYLLDNFGLSPQSVFTSYTFEEFANLDRVPAPEEFIERIIDLNSIIEMYSCDRSEFKTIEELNDLIKNGFNKCKKIK